MIRLLRILFVALLSSLPCIAADAYQKVYSTRFVEAGFGQLPAGWTDLVNYRPMRNWAVDANGLLRVTWKDYLGHPADGERLRRIAFMKDGGLDYLQGLLVYDGVLADKTNGRELADVEITGTLRKTPDRDVFGGLIVRVKDRDNYYALELSGGRELRLLKVEGNRREVLSSVNTVGRMEEFRHLVNLSSGFR